MRRAPRRPARRRRASIEESGLGEFDVGKAIYGLITAGFLHRVGRTKAGRARGQRFARGRAPQPRRRVLQDGHARRGDARVPPRRRAARARLVGTFYIGLALLRQGKWEEAVTAFQRVRARSRARAPRRCTTSRTRSSGSAGTTRRRRRSTRPCGAAARRIRASRRRSACVALRTRRRRRRRRRRCQVARPLFGTRPPDGGVVPLRGAHRGAARRARSRRRAAAGGDRGAPARGGAAQQPRRRARAARLSSRRAAGGRARRARGRRARRSCTRISATATTARRATTTRSSRYQRAVKHQSAARRRRVPQARQHPVQAAGARRGGAVLGAGARARSRRTRSCARISTRCGRSCDRAPSSPTPRFAALTAKIAARSRLRLRELQGQVPAPPHRGAHARARRAHVRRLRARARQRQRRVRPAARRAHDQRHEAVPELGDVHGAARAGRAGALGSCPIRVLNVWSAGCSSGEEPYSLAALFHEHAERLGARGDGGAARPRARQRHRRAIARRRRSAATFEESDFSRDAGGAAAALLRARRRRSRSSPEVRRMVRFERRDLLAEAPPPGPHHLICCRNVLIYFDRETQERLFQKFRDALAPTGFLVLGKVETLLGRGTYSLRGRRRPRAHLPATVSTLLADVRVKVADYAVRRGNDIIATIGLGSCVAIALYDRDIADRRARAHPAAEHGDVARDVESRRSSRRRSCRSCSTRCARSAWRRTRAVSGEDRRRREHVRPARQRHGHQRRRAEHRRDARRRSRGAGSRSSPRTRGSTTAAACTSTSTTGAWRCGRSRREIVSSSGPATVLVVDDSAFMRRVIGEIIDGSPRFPRRRHGAQRPRRAAADPRARAGHRDARRRDAGARRAADARLHHERDAARRRDAQRRRRRRAASTSPCAASSWARWISCASHRARSAPTSRASRTRCSPRCARRRR